MGKILTLGGQVLQRPKRITIGMPFGRPLDLPPHCAWVDLTIHAVHDSNFLILEKYTKTAYLDLNRDKLAQYALDSNSDYLLMIDSDMSYPPNILKVLVSRDKDVIGVAYYTPRWNPKEKKSDRVGPIIYDYNQERGGWGEWPYCEETEPFRVDAVGTGIMLIKTEVFRKLEKPWFPFFVYKDKKDTRIMGEDLGFCMKCLAAGIEVWVDPTFEDEIVHWKPYGFSKKDCKANEREEKKRAKVSKDVK